VSARAKWPTPMSGKSQISGQFRRDMAKAMQQWPTPTVNGNTNRPGASETSGYGLRSAVVDWTGVSGPLNPTWVEWLMGWPLGWTDLEPLATAKYPSAPPPRGGCSVQATIPEIPCAA
jgi:hypothetical protein